jgi:oligoendopeptidase F
MTTPTLVRFRERRFLPEAFRVQDWEGLEPFYRDLLARPLRSREELLRWMADRSELEAAVQEDARWRFVQSTRDTGNPEFLEAFRAFTAGIKPQVSRVEQALDRKFLDCPHAGELPDDTFLPYRRKLHSRQRLYREENVELQAEHELLQKEYERITGRMGVELDGRTYTMPQAGVALSDPDRTHREAIYLRLANRRLEEKIEFDDLFDRLVAHRTRMARNAGFTDYRDFQFANLGRFDYGPQDCFAFHEAIEREVMPMVRFLDLRKATLLDLETLRPWDQKVGCTGRHAGRPFRDAEDMLDKGIEVFYRLDPLFGDTLSTMRHHAYLDLESRMGKAPGGYNCPMPESGLPFIFMNASGASRDVKTIVHEGGHAVHAVLARDLPYTGLRETPSELAELAAMGMEFLSYEHWDVFYPEPERLCLARIEHLERVINLLPWVATIDAFQHWVYTHPEHDAAERERQWLDIHRRYSSPEIDWTGFDHYRVALWQTQLHLFKAPFYYIEYAFAQLGAIALWRNHQRDPAGTLAGYKEALALGYTRPIGETYAAAGIRFDFSRGYVRELVAFLHAELEALFDELATYG